MFRSNWQGAIWRGAMLVVLLWAGLAWTQTPAPHPGDGAERFVYVHENGNKTRCRVLESWRLPDGRMAHLLETVETNEKITIVDEPGLPGGPAGTNQWGRQKRIFSWGLGRRTPPEGSPIPPHLMQDSGVVVRNDAPAPDGGQPAGPPIIINQSSKAPAPTPLGSVKAPGTQVLEFQNQPGSPPTMPLVIAQPPAAPAPNVFLPAVPIVNPASNGPPVMQGPASTVQPPSFPHDNGRAMSPLRDCVCDPAQSASKQNPTDVRPFAGSQPAPLSAPSDVLPPPPSVCPTPAGALPAPSGVLPPPVIMSPAQSGTAAPPSAVPPTPAVVVVAPPSVVAPTPTVAVTPPLAISVMPTRPTDAPGSPAPADPAPTISVSVDPNTPAAAKPADTAAKKPWRPGEALFGWMNKPTAPPAELEFTKPEEPKPLKNDDFLTQQNKVAEKRINDRLSTLPKVPFSTALAQGSNPPANPPDTKKPELSPLAIPGAPEHKVDTVPPPGPSKDEVKPASVAGAEKRDMWGTSTPDKLPPTGKALLEPTAMPAEVVKLPPPPQARANDPLTLPERFNPSPDKMRPKATVLPPVEKAAAETGGLPPTPRYAPQGAMPPGPPAGMGQPNGWPMGSQSVLAARSGLQSPVVFVPVPTVTVPQPNHPPMPPPPAMPDAPQLNAYVNAFTPPQPPKGPAPTGPGSTPDWMQPNPMMQQQALMQQQMMQQQMMQQQQMLAQGYRPNPMNPYLPYNQPMPSAGPMVNYGRGYQGPMAPNPFGAAPALAGGYMPAGYPPMMPQQPVLQPVSFQQMPTQQAAITQQVEQIIKVMRESPYPAQREWAAQSLTSFEWRAHPQVVPALLQSASQDPAASVRAGCVSCLGRMGAAVEPVFGVLHAMRNDIDPRVRQEVEQAFVRLGQAPIAPH